MKYHISADAIGILPIMGGFIAKLGDEIGWGKLIAGGLLTFILAGIAWNLNTISVDIRDLRSSVKTAVICTLEKAASNAERIGKVEVIQQQVLKRNEDEDRRIEKIEDWMRTVR